MLAIQRITLAFIFMLLTLPLNAQQPERTRRDPFKQWDKNADGFLSLDEFPKQLGERLFKRIDADKDGRISRKEDDTYRARNRRNNSTVFSVDISRKSVTEIKQGFESIITQQLGEILTSQLVKA